MSLVEWIVPIRHTHVALVAASGALFALRGAAVLAGARWPMRRTVRVASVVIDTLLLAAGATLWWLLQLNPLLRDPWLGAKLLLLVAYIALGTTALKGTCRPAVRAATLLAALTVYATMISMALTRSPLGAWGRWG